MLYQLLTLLLPYRATPFEMEFHIQFVLRAYRDYYERLAATGLRDRAVLTSLRRRVAYSMSILLWRRPILWLRICCFHYHLSRLKKSVLPLDRVSKLIPYDELLIGFHHQ
jgi:hypothetical protein